MSGDTDKLAQFQQNIDSSDVVVVIGAGFAQKVLDVAKAARDFDAHVLLNGGCHTGCPEHDALRAALSALDGDT